MLWHFNPINEKPVVNYDAVNATHIVQANSKIQLNEPLALLFPEKFGIELSRSKFPFSAITCFTDHCDFDTIKNLKKQRQFFKKYDIKLTKGFFLNHFSKRDGTASYQLHSEELNLWLQDGHELAYHSLSQSIKPLEESINDFVAFEPPLNTLYTWIDHGFQPYNVSLYKNYNKLISNYGNNLRQKSIKHLWNYIDSGTAVNGVINQLNPNQFTLKTYYKGVKHFGRKTALKLMIKNVIFHYFTDNEGLFLYKQVARYLKTLKRKKSRKKHFRFIAHSFKLLALLVPVFLFWRFKKNKVYPLAQYTPLVFDDSIDEQSFNVFQTIEMIDFKNALNKDNVDLLIEESGLFIAHTYFSAPMNYHQGKLFNNAGEIDNEVEDRFNYLATKITSKDIWNPTLNELIVHLKKLKNVVFDCNEKGELVVVNDANNVVFRQVL